MSKTNSQLDIWRKKMHQLCPNPKVGEIVVLSDEENNKKDTYRALTSDGYNTHWKKVSSEKLNLRIIEGAPDNLDDYEYMSDGMYIHKDDAWW